MPVLLLTICSLPDPEVRERVESPNSNETEDCQKKWSDILQSYSRCRGVVEKAASGQQHKKVCGFTFEFLLLPQKACYVQWNFQWNGAETRLGVR